MKTHGFTFQRLCQLQAAKNLYEAGVPVGTIAKQARRSPSTIRRWLLITRASKPENIRV